MHGINRFNGIFHSYWRRNYQASSLPSRLAPMFPCSFPILSLTDIVCPKRNDGPVDKSLSQVMDARETWWAHVIRRVVVYLYANWAPTLWLPHYCIATRVSQQHVYYIQGVAWNPRKRVPETLEKGRVLPCFRVVAVRNVGPSCTSYHSNLRTNRHIPASKTLPHPPLISFG